MLKTAVLLIDIQNDYFPGGAMECVKSTKAGENAGTILKWARDKKVIPIHIRHISTRHEATFFLPGTFGSEIYELVSPLPGELVLIKHFPNSFRETNLEEILRENKIEKLVITGMMTHMCIDATVRAATDLGYSCTLIHDACATRELTFAHERVPSHIVHASFISSLSGLYARIFSTEEFISNPEFNPLSKTT